MLSLINANRKRNTLWEAGDPDSCFSRYWFSAVGYLNSKACVHGSNLKLKVLFVENEREFCLF